MTESAHVDRNRESSIYCEFVQVRSNFPTGIGVKARNDEQLFLLCDLLKVSGDVHIDLDGARPSSCEKLTGKHRGYRA